MKPFVALIGGLVAVLVLAGQLARASTTPSVINDGAPVMSSNGVDVAFFRDSPALGPRVMDGTAAGTSIHAVATGFLRGWLPGTERLLVQAGGETLLLPDNDRYQVPFAVFHGVQASASPDGTRVAYLRSGAWYVSSADGSAERPVATEVVDPSIDVTGAVWSPDGARLAYGNGPDLDVARADGGGVTRVYAGAEGQTGNPTWSPDGATIAFETNAGAHWAVHEVDADGSDPRTISGDYNARFPRFSPVGGELAYISDRQHVRGGATRYQYALYVAGRKVLGDVKPDTPPAWSPTAAQIVVSAGQGCGRFGIYILRPDAPKHARRITNRCRVNGTARDDTLRARNGMRDFVDCGAGRDTAYVDRIDVVRHCERVFRK